MSEYIIAGFRFATLAAWGAILLVEFFGSEEGIGFQANYWYDAGSFTGMMAWGFVMLVVIVAIDKLDHGAGAAPDAPLACREHVLDVVGAASAAAVLLAGRGAGRMLGRRSRKPQLADFVQRPDSRLIKVQTRGRGGRWPDQPTHRDPLAHATAAFGEPSSMAAGPGTCRCDAGPDLGLTIEFDDRLRRAARRGIVHVRVAWSGSRAGWMAHSRGHPARCSPSRRCGGSIRRRGVFARVGWRSFRPLARRADPPC